MKNLFFIAVAALFATSFLNAQPLDIQQGGHSYFSSDGTTIVGSLNASVSQLQKLHSVKFNFSDERLKQKIVELKAYLAEHPDDSIARSNLAQMEKDVDLDKGLHYGFIPTELRDIYPELVSADQSGYLDIEYMSMIPVLTEVLKELKLKVDALKGQNYKAPEKPATPTYVITDKCQMKNVEPLNATIAQLSKFNSVKYQHMHRVFYGFTPEEVREVFPELVWEHTDGSSGVNYLGMVPVLLDATKSLKAELDALKGNDFKSPTKPVDAVPEHLITDKCQMKNVELLNASIEQYSKLNSVKFNFSDERLKQKIEELKAYLLEHPDDSIARSNLVQMEKDVDLDKRVHYGFNPLELREIHPSLVFEDQYGYLDVSYFGMIPVLSAVIVDIIKDMQLDIEEIIFQSMRGISSSGSSDLGILYQNSSNPFSESTEIKFYIPDNAGSASLLIYDATGSIVQKIDVSDRGNSSITIKGKELKAGMYMYSLLIDGKEIDTKRMILTK